MTTQNNHTNGVITTSIDEWVDAHLLRLAFRNNFANISVNLAAAIGMFLVVPASSGRATGFGAVWLASILVLSLSRYAHSIWVTRRLREEPFLFGSQQRSYLAGYAAGLLMAVCLWGAMTGVAISSNMTEIRYAVLVIISALAAGATGILAPQLVVGRIYIAAMLLQGSAALMFSDQPHYLLAALGAIFTVVMLISHRNNHQVLRQSFELQYRNNELVARLKTERNLLEELNATLETRVRDRTAELKALAEQDPLTGVLNRNGLMRWCEEADVAARERGAPDLVAIFIDLDRFKQINDGLGHTIGDRVLVEVARRLRVSLGDHGALGRWGGDEFVAIVTAPPGHPLDWASELASRMRYAVEEPIHVAGRQLLIGFSAGVAVTAGERTSIGDAIHYADLAAGDAKRKGRGLTQVYKEKLLAEQERNLAICQALKTAIAQNELSVLFQPVVAAPSRAVVAYEALLRWNSREYGPISPDEFIPMAEDTGDIVPLGNFVLDAALGQLVRSGYHANPLKMAVNVSLRQLIAPGFLEAVRLSLDRHAVRPADLILEVTETIFDTRQQPIISFVLHQLNSYGVEIHIDDFGTGYSSLSRLHELPIHALKIDRSFVHALDTHGTAIIEGTALIARKLGIHIIAEGVETPLQARQLEEMGIEYLQGYLFGRPSPKLLESRHIQSA
ncbi:GGDEF and EAL domain-containing protein [Rhizobium sp. CSW-27]|uniref:putative bifunctional diguanylate cyclase/phosphodiesterase n=1 Tax=Rhizobium sp. CSW-27 TaxID=2839985 RepID=UPI001C0250EE|nr:GGDEF and EAL domain-containing protein [Rhizobium sp. CSW-27]MBT9371731.1 EAL domain-containing protein [Rhizobium sp. CSW-27]